MRLADLSPIALAVPFFFVLIGIELVAARLLRREVYRLDDTLADLGCGILQQVVGVFIRGALVWGYVALYEHARILELSSSSLSAWIALFIGVDFFYYWFHRVSHERNLLWAAHVVHHQSEEYNLAVALRQGALQPAVSWVFYLPLAWLGFPPAMFLLMASFNTLYQFWIHTRLIRRLGPLEWIINTPSHHRVHHGRDPKYLDRNHGGTLIIWDRLFGTFQQEEEEPTYGVTAPPRSWSALSVHLQPFREILALARRTPRGLDRLRLLWAAPGWVPEGVELEPGHHVDDDAPKFATHAPRGQRGYAAAQFIVALLGSLPLIADVAISSGLRSALALGVVATLASVGALLEGRPAALRFEGLRLAIVGVPLIALAWPEAPVPAVAGAAGLAVSAIWLALGRARWSGGLSGVGAGIAERA